MGTCTWKINRKSRVSYPGPTFLSSATWHSLSKKHYNGLINQSINLLRLYHRVSLISLYYETNQYMRKYGRTCFANAMDIWGITMHVVMDLMVGWLVMFYVSSTARSFRDGTPFTVPCEGSFCFYTIPTGDWTPGHHVAVHYITAAPAPLAYGFELVRLCYLDIYDIWNLRYMKLAKKNWYLHHRFRLFVQILNHMHMQKAVPIIHI